MGYNPYRKENGEFSTKEEAGAKAGSDYDSAVKSGDDSRVQEVGDYIVENFPKSEKAQEILTSRYNPLYGTKKGEKKAERIKQSELNKEVKESDDPEFLEHAAEVGSVRVLSNIVRNEHSSEKALLTAVERAKGYDKIREDAEQHINFPISRTSTKSIIKFRNDWNRKKLAQVERYANSDELTDGDAARLLRAGGSNRGIIFNHDNKVSSEFLSDYVDRGFYNLYEGAQDNPKLDMSRIRMNRDKARTISVSSENPDHIRIAWNEIKKEDDWTDYSRILGNEHTPSDVFEDAMKNDYIRNNDENLTAIYQNRNADEKFRKFAIEHSPTARSLQKIDALESSGKLKNILTKKTQGSYQGRGYQFDAEKVQALGLDAHDIDALVRRKWGDYLFGTSYDEKTGVYSGYID